jgi:hypothetical protein
MDDSSSILLRKTQTYRHRKRSGYPTLHTLKQSNREIVAEWVAYRCHTIEALTVQICELQPLALVCPFWDTLQLLALQQFTLRRQPYLLSGQTALAFGPFGDFNKLCSEVSYGAFLSDSRKQCRAASKTGIRRNTARQAASLRPDFFHS